MTIVAVCLLLAAAGLRTRLGRLVLAHQLLRASNVLHEAGSRALAHAKREAGQ